MDDYNDIAEPPMTMKQFEAEEAFWHLVEVFEARGETREEAVYLAREQMLDEQYPAAAVRY